VSGAAGDEPRFPGDLGDTDLWSSREPSDAPPPGSLAAWLAKTRDEGGAPPAPRGKRRRSDESAEDQFWICSDLLPAIPLGGEVCTLTLGRSPDADVVLPHSQVSRVHGKIKVLGLGSYIYEDNGSSNGSFLNGSKMVSSKLSVGDVIGIGPYEIELHSSQSLRARSGQSELEPDDGDHTRVMAIEPEAAMTGRLNEVPIAEILQGLEFNRKTGSLGIHSEAGRGYLVVCQGFPIQAAFAGEQDDEAVIRMAGLRDGRFEFNSSVEPGEPRFKASLTALLLEATRRADEQAR